MIIKFDNFLIRKLTIKDASIDYLKWFKDPEIKKYIVNKNYSNLNELKKFLICHTKNKNEIFLGIFLKNGNHVGNIKFEKINLKKKTAYVGILIGEKKWRGKNLATKALSLSIEWVYNKLSINRFFLGVSKENISAIKAYKKCGFRIKTTKKNKFIMLNNKWLLNASRISIGTAQFGMDYGIANSRGKVSYSECKKIIKFAEKNGIYTIDTSPKYGDAEKILGKIGVRNWDVITKLPSLFNNNILMSTQNLNKFVNDSLKRLRINSLYALLIHDPSDLKINGLSLINKLKKIKNKGKIKRIGVSITHFEDLKFITKKLPIDIVQVAFNIFDQRLNTSGLLNYLNSKNIEIHTRSVFLQGLILKSTNKIPKKFTFYKNYWIKLKKFIEKKKISKVDLCMNFVLGKKKISKATIGFDSFEQLQQILKTKKINIANLKSLAVNNEILITPNLWGTLH